MRIEDIREGGKYLVKEGRLNQCGSLTSNAHVLGLECAYIVVNEITELGLSYTGRASDGSKISSCWACLTADDIEPYSLFNEGDVVLDRYQDEYTVNEVTPKGYFVLKDEKGIASIWTEDELRRHSLVLKKVEEAVEMTVAEVEKALGHAVKIVKGDE